LFFIILFSLSAFETEIFSQIELFTVVTIGIIASLVLLSGYLIVHTGLKSSQSDEMFYCI